MIFYFFGEDSFRSHQHLQQIIGEFKKKRDQQGYNVVILDALDISEHKILTEMQTIPFLAKKRLIVIKNILSIKDKELLTKLINIIKNNKIPETNIVVFWQAEKIGRVKEIKTLETLLKKQLYKKQFNLLKGVELEKWLQNQIKERNGKAEHNVVKYLAQNAGYDMWFLNSLLDQLISYDKKVCLKSVQLFLNEKTDDNIFNMIEAIVSGDKKRALKLLNKQRELGKNENKIFGLIIWQFKILLEMRDLFEKQDGINSLDMANKLKLHQFVVKKNLYLAKRFNLIQLKDIHQRLLDIDIKTKTGLADQSLLVDLFAVSV